MKPYVEFVLALSFAVTTSVAQVKPTLNCAVDSRDPKAIVIDEEGLVLTSISNPSYWLLYAHSIGTKEATRINIVDAKLKASENRVTLVLDTALTDDVDTITGVLAAPKSIVPITQCAIAKPGGAAAENAFKAAKGRADSDVYFNGSYTAVAGASPIYSIDAFAGYMHAIGPKDEYVGKVGFYGQTKTKSSTDPSPNSYLAYAVFQRVFVARQEWLGPFQMPYLNYRVAGVEFDQQGNNTNVVDSPVITLPFRLSGRTLGVIRPGGIYPHATLIVGAEFVHPSSSPLPEANWLTRGLVGGTFSAGYAAGKAYLDSLTFTAVYQLRLPSSPEVYYDDRFAEVNPKTGKKITPPRLGTQPRPYVDAKLTYNLAKWAGVTFEYSYGSLPPAFVKTKSTFALGLTFTLQQSSYGRYSILRP